MPYFEPSRPIPDSLPPPKEAISLEIIPSLIPTISYSKASETRHTLPVSRVQMYEAKPTSMSLAIASFSVSNLN